VSDHADVLRLTALAEGRAEVHLLTADRERLKATLAELAALRAEVGILSAAKAGARYIAERDTLRQRLADIEAGHGMRAHECCDEVIRLRLRLEEAVKKHAVCVSTIDCLQRDLGALEQRLAEVERTPQALGTKIPGYWHEAKTLWPWLPSQPAIQLDDEWRNRTRAENALWLIEKAEQRAERAETALAAVREMHSRFEVAPGRYYVSMRGVQFCKTCMRPWPCKTSAALAPVAEPAKCLRCDGSGEVQCGPPSDGPIPCPKCTTVAEQPEPAGEEVSRG
jgi:hypothetical protein